MLHWENKIYCWIFLMHTFFYIYIFNIIPYAFIPRLQVVPNFSQAIVEGIKYRKLSLTSPAWAYTTS